MLTDGTMVDGIRWHEWAIREGAAFAAARVQLSKLSERTAEEVARDVEASGVTAARRRDGNVAVIPIHGILGPKAGWLEAATEVISRQCSAAVNDPGTKAIVLDIDSPGGLVNGTPELADEIFAARGSKPILAAVNTDMHSGAFWIGAQADEVLISPSGMAGSVGVFTMHMDQSKMLGDMGINVTFIHAGRYKVEGNQAEPLSDETEEFVKAQLEERLEQFHKALARGRGKGVSAVTSGFGEGRSFMAAEVVKRGMADRIGTLSDALARVGASVASRERIESLKQRQSVYNLRAQMHGVDLTNTTQDA